jgi:hypothetical protein
MNVLDHYEVDRLDIGNAIEMDDDHYFCKLSYDDEPFLIRTGHACTYRKKADPSSTYAYVSVTHKDYLEWFEEFYKGVISRFHRQSLDWFEEPMTHHEFECSFINPLKSNIKQQCFDILCKTDEKLSLDELEDVEAFPTFHVKGIRFNTKHFMFDIELVQLEPIEAKDIPSVVPLTVPSVVPLTSSASKSPATVPLVVPLVVPLTVPLVPVDEDVIEEYCPSVEDLEETELDLEQESIFDIYDTINERIKEDMVENIRKLFLQKNLKVKLHLAEVVDDEEPETE